MPWTEEESWAGKYTEGAESKLGVLGLRNTLIVDLSRIRISSLGRSFSDVRATAETLTETSRGS